MDILDYAAEKAAPNMRPLADRMRPERLKDFVGQSDLIGKGTLIRHAIENDEIFSMIFWGPPGCGKTTLAGIIAKESRAHYVQFSAVLSGVKNIRAVIKDAKEQKRLFHRKTVLFVDEIHRFNKAQQDAFLHHVESGLITLVGATTENPSFEVIPALLSRCRVIMLKSLSSEAIKKIIHRALLDTSKGYGNLRLILSDEALSYLVKISEGDARTALNNLEVAVSMSGAASCDKTRGEKFEIALKDLQIALQKKALLYDKDGEEHFNLISAFHKSLRGSDPDAALYWLSRMISAGEDPIYIGRRMIRFASEDIGNADPNALGISLSAVEAFRLLGQPEGELALVQAVIYLATAPKSNRIYTAHLKVQKTIKKTGAIPVPYHIRNAPTQLMRDFNYGKDYKYPHDFKEACVSQTYLPDMLKGENFYFPSNRGYEREIKKRLEKWRSVKDASVFPTGEKRNKP